MYFIGISWFESALYDPQDVVSWYLLNPVDSRYPKNCKVTQFYSLLIAHPQKFIYK